MMSLSSTKLVQEQLPACNLNGKTQNTLVMILMSQSPHRTNPHLHLDENQSPKSLIFYYFYFLLQIFNISYSTFFSQFKLAFVMLAVYKKLIFIYKSQWKISNKDYQQIQYILGMITQLTLKDAVSKIYGHSLIDSGSPVTQWQLFSPFSLSSTNSMILLKLLEVPAHIYTSEQICNQKLEKFREVLHEIKLIFVERCFQSSYYLVIAQKNLISLKSLVKVKKQANEKIDELVIYDFLQFGSKLQNHPHANQISFNLDQIAINSQGKFVLTNYHLYFEKDQIFKSQRRQIKNKQRLFANSLKQKIIQVLTQMLLLQNQCIELSDLYQIVQLKYGNNMVYLIQKCIQTQFDSSQVTSLITSLRKSNTDQSFSAVTVTDSYVEDSQKLEQNLTNQSCNNTGIEESFRKIQNYKKMKRRKILGFIFAFVIILMGIGAITFKYLRPRPLQCQQNQYADQNNMKCLNCDLSCQRCVGGESSMCLSCKGAQYLIINNYTDKTGKCSLDCKGTIIKTKTCVVNH